MSSLILGQSNSGYNRAEKNNLLCQNFQWKAMAKKRESFCLLQTYMYVSCFTGKWPFTLLDYDAHDHSEMPNYNRP